MQQSNKSTLSVHKLYWKCPLLAWTHARSLPRHWSISNLVKNRHRSATVHFQVIHSMDLSVCGRHNAAWQPRSRNPQDWDLGCLEATGWTQERLAFLDATVQLLHVRGAVCRCTVLLEQSHYQTLCVSLAAAWRHYDIVKQHRRSQKEISPEFPAL